MSATLKNGFSYGGLLARTLPHHLEIDSFLTDPHEKWMALAILEAMNGIGWASPNPSVGCVIVKNEKVLAKGFTQSFGGKHAERMAFESLQLSYEINTLSDLTVYVTLEPCTHIGKQPACVELLLHAAVKRVVIACMDPDSRVCGAGIQLLRDTGKDVLVGVLGNEARAWHLPFLWSREKKGPLWVAKWAENQDGLLADDAGDSKWITNKDSRAYGHWLRQKYDTILVGAGTWLKDSPQLTVRDCAEPHRRNPVILIHDPKDRLAGGPAGLVRNQSTFIFKQQNTPDLIKAIHETDFGFELQSVFCEGGARTLNELFLAGRIDLVHRFTGHKDFGPLPSAIHRIAGFQPGSPNSPWRRATSAKLGNDHLHEWVK